MLDFSHNTTKINILVNCLDELAIINLLPPAHQPAELVNIMLTLAGYPSTTNEQSEIKKTAFYFVDRAIDLLKACICSSDNTEAISQVENYVIEAFNLIVNEPMPKRSQQLQKLAKILECDYKLNISKKACKNLLRVLNCSTSKSGNIHYSAIVGYFKKRFKLLLENSEILFIVNAIKG